MNRSLTWQLLACCTLLACGGSSEEGGTEPTDVTAVDSSSDGSGDTTPDAGPIPDADDDDADATSDSDSGPGTDTEDGQGGPDADDTGDADDTTLSDADGDGAGDDAGDGSDSDSEADADTGTDTDSGSDDAGEDTDTTVVCDLGFENIDNACVDIDECLTETDSCDELVECTNLIGGFECGPCPDGYDDIDFLGEECINLDECTLELDECDPLSPCTDTPGSYECAPCPDGYDDINGDGTLCENIDECALESDGCDDLVTCTDTPGAYACSPCPDGYDDVNGDGTLCTDVNECVTEADNCDPLAACANLPGGFVCGECASGYDDINGDGTLCENIDECETGTDPCDALVECTDTIGSVECGACPLGYRDVNGDGTRCDSRFESPPVGAPQCYLWGTAHLRSFDGLAYDVQGAGEWQLALSGHPGALAVQVRQTPLTVSSAASETTLTAIGVGAQIVTIEPGTPPVVTVDGEVIVPSFAGSAITDGSIHLVANAIVVRTDRDDQVRVTSVADTRLDVEVYPAPGEEGDWRGLCGNQDGAPVGDILPPTGPAILPPVEIERLYAEFIHAWRVNAGTSLMPYEALLGPDDFFDAAHPTAYVEAKDLPDADRTLYLPGCLAADLGHPFVDEACVLDAYWSDIDRAIESASRVREPELILPLDKPLLFANWQQQGLRAAGNWIVSPDFASVLQTINGEPTMFVSPNEYINVEIEGTIQVTDAGDDDLVGFVFGFRSPIEDAGDEPRVFDTYLLDWKQANQASNGATAFEGFALSYVAGDFSDTWVPFWGRTDEARWTVLDTLYDVTRGWADLQVNEFRLVHREDRIDIFMNGELIFRVSGDFQDGRFGFYNYSQPNVRYADFRVRPIEADDFCGNGSVGASEECDDGNNVSGDGCSSGCVIE